MTPNGPATHSSGLLSRLSENDRERLGEATRRLLTSGSILGLEPAQNDLYHWCYQNREWVEELAALLDLKLHWDHQDRMVQAVPQSASFVLKLPLDATLVLLTLWYEFDTALRDRGDKPPVSLTVQQFNDSFGTKFKPITKERPISPTRLREILSLAQRKNLLRFMPEADFPLSHIEILSTLKRIIPFQNIEEWNKNAEKYLAAVKELPTGEAVDLDSDSGETREAP